MAMIFESGLSTQHAADQDAGRGVGLDAVRTLIAKLGGRIRIGAIRGEYCQFRVYLPLIQIAAPQHKLMELTQ